ncbi:MAG: DUF393 domain-containing protein [Hyphomicrobiaceae bacterium]|nr:DUF393 domain-containing protein [Hyphomicrobiaceae bacterium]
MHPITCRDAYSYRDDPAVPDFDDDGPRVFMDGECVLCTAGARLIARFDRAGAFRIIRVQSDTGRAVLKHYGLNPDDPESWLYLVEGKAHAGLDGMIRAGARIGGPGRLLQVFRVLPGAVQEWLYRRMARNRYRLFGRTDMCAVADPELRARLVE